MIRLGRRRPAVIASAKWYRQLATPCLASAFLACAREEGDAKKPLSAPKARNQAIVAAPNATPAEASAPPLEATPQPSKAPRKLCSGQWQQPGKDLSTQKLERAAAAGAPLPPEQLDTGGSYTWVNFWAAWCVPCREEIPLLMRWEKELGTAKPGLKLVFVSLDDDERQLKQFLAAQPTGGLRSSYWLREGTPREEWFKTIDADPDPELPVHVLLDPKGKARCVVNGAVKESDFSALKKLLRG